VSEYAKLAHLLQQPFELVHLCIAKVSSAELTFAMQSELCAWVHYLVTYFTYKEFYHDSECGTD